jgi:hypothetical protein
MTILAIRKLRGDLIFLMQDAKVMTKALTLYNKVFIMIIEIIYLAIYDVSQLNEEIDHPLACRAGSCSWVQSFLVWF